MKKVFIVILLFITSVFLFNSCRPSKEDTQDNSNETVNQNTDPAVDLSSLKMLDRTYTYDGGSKGTIVSGDIPAGVTVEYIGNDCIDVGSYTVIAKFYKSGVYIEGADLTATVTITPADYDMSGVSLLNSTVTYNGEEIVPKIKGKLPEGVSVEYDYDTIVNVGTYVVVAKFTGDSNHNPIMDMTAIYTVLPAEYDMDDIVFSNKVVEYNGNPHFLTIEGILPDGLSVEYLNNGQTDVGNYYVEAVFTSNNSNYNTPDSMIAMLIITAEVVLPVEPIYNLKADDTYEVVGCLDGNSYLTIPAFYNNKLVTSIASGAFEGNENLTYVDIPVTVTSIGNKAFKDCTSLSLLTVGKGVEVIGYQAFANVPISNLVLPDTLISIGQGALMGMPLEFLKIPFVGGSAKSSNDYLGYLFGATSYSGNAATVPTTLKIVTLSDAAEKIPAFAFYGVSSIEEIIVGKNVYFIGINAFVGTSLKYIYIPKTVTDIPADAYVTNSPFYGLGNDTVVVLEGIAGTGYGKYWNYVGNDKKTITVYMKTYDYYLDNKETIKDLDKSLATLTDILIDGEVLTDFSDSVTEYVKDVDINSGFPKVEAFSASPTANVKIEQATVANGGIATITVISADETSTLIYKVRFNLIGTFNTSGEVVNKNGTDGTVSFVIDDGDRNTANITRDLLEKYEELELTYAILANQLATLTTRTSSGQKSYVLDADGKYTYTVKADAVTFWNNMLDDYNGRTEVISHSYSHAFWGTNDDGGSFKYVDSSGNLKTSDVMPIGSATAEILASKQIIEDLLGIEAITHVVPGISVKETDVTVNGELITTYNTYYQQLLSGFINDGTLAGIRGNVFQNGSFILTNKDNISKNGVRAFMVSNKDNVSDWKKYIDQSVDINGLAVFCIHKIIEDGATGSGHYIYESMAEEIFAYAIEQNVWVANYTEATLYFTEWASADVATSYENGRIKVTLTDEEDNNLYDEALTVKVRVPTTWNSATVNGEVLTVHTDNDGCFVYVDIVPDSGTVEIIGA